MICLVRTKAVVWAAAALIFAMPRGICAQDTLVDAAPISHDDVDRVLVLHDGGVLVGRITRDNDRYLLKHGGTQLQIPAAKVLCVAASLDDAYAQRSRQMGSPTAESHLKLADWCLRHNLLEHAKRELVAARRLEWRNGKLVLLERRLALAQERQQNPATTQSASEPPSPAAISATVDAGISDLPEGAVERFTRRVQPILVNNCTASGCHQSGGAAKFQLDRALLHGLANRRTTMQNLSAALALVDRERPAQSQLLTVPRRTHGGMKEPIFGPRQQAAFRHLAEWVALVTESASSSDTETASGSDDLIAAEDTPSSRLVSPVMRVQWQDDEPFEADSEFAPSDEQLAPPQPVRFGAQLKRWQPRDPFDPEIFNRRNAPRTHGPPSPSGRGPG